MIIRSFLFTMLVSMISFSASATEYQVFDAEDAERSVVCEVFKKNLDFYKDQPPFHYEWPIHPSMTELNKPTWVALNPVDHMDLIKELYLAFGYFYDRGEKVFYWDKEQFKINAWVKKNLIKLEEASIDISDKNVKVYRLGHPAYIKAQSRFAEDIGVISWWHYIPPQNGLNKAYHLFLDIENDDLFIFNKGIYIISDNTSLSHEAVVKRDDQGVADKNLLRISRIETAGRGAYGDNHVCVLKVGSL